MRISHIVDISKMNVKPDPTVFVNFHSTAFALSQESNINAFNGLLCWFKLFKFIHIFPRMKMLTRVLLTVKHFDVTDLIIYLFIGSKISDSLFVDVLRYFLGICFCSLDFNWRSSL
jgi:hypothetical protein